MNEEMIIEGLFRSLCTGDREGARSIVSDARAAGATSEDIATQVFWPVLEEINKLFRADQLSTLAHHYATRLLRQLVDQGQADYTQRGRRDKKILMFSGHSEADELAGQLGADLLEADGYQVYFAGGGIANDEILAEVGEHRPDILLMFASAPTDAPNIRAIIDKIRGVGACPNMQMVVGGGVFNRAEGLAEEIGADLWAKDPAEMIVKLESEGTRRATAEQRTVGRNQRSARTKAA